VLSELDWYQKEICCGLLARLHFCKGATRGVGRFGHVSLVAYFISGPCGVPYRCFPEFQQSSEESGSATESDRPSDDDDDGDDSEQEEHAAREEQVRLWVEILLCHIRIST